MVVAGIWYVQNKFNKNQSSLPVEFNLLDRGNSGLYGQGISDLNNVEDRYKKLSVSLIDNQADWKRFWDSNIRQSGTGGFQGAPEVDFNSKYVLAVLQGVKPTGGYYLLVKEILFSNNSLIVKVEIVEPKSGEPNTQSITSPYDVVSVAKLNQALKDKYKIIIENAVDGKVLLEDNLANINYKNQTKK